MFRVASVAVVAALELSVVAGRAADPARSWSTNDHSAALLQDGREVWRFNYGPDHPKPSFHPVTLNGAADLTWFRPEDHPWHRGLWFSWKFINGVNYWEEDRVTGVSEGLTETLETQVETRPDFSAQIKQHLRYRPAGGPAVLSEERTIEISPPAEDGSITMDWVLKFEALADIVLDRTPLPEEPGGQVYGGYAGLSVRLAQEFAGIGAVTIAGPVTFVAERFRGRSTGMDYHGSLAGQDVGLAILDHPKNLNAPSPWYAIGGDVMRYFSPAVLCYGPHHLAGGEGLTLRYRVVVHPGRWDADRLIHEATRFGEAG